ncbi:MAG: hypothetical protein ACK5MH_07505 [Bacteroidales bacterium]
MDKNPFSLYDFLGYVMPGAFALIIACITLPESILSIDCSILELFDVKNIILLVIVSYILGHFIAFVSSITIEKFSIWSYEYPSKYLMDKFPPTINYFGIRKLIITKQNKNNKDEDLIWIQKDINKKEDGFKENTSEISKISRYDSIVLSICKYFLFFLLLPISSLSLLFGEVIKINRTVLKPLDSFLKECIKMKTEVLLDRLCLNEIHNKDISDKKSSSEKDNLRIIYHYQYERQTKQARKMDNYIALYGFLRSLTFIFVVEFDYLFIEAIVTIFKAFSKDYFYPDWKLIIVLIVIACTAYIFYLAFLKFYRRYSLECFMALVTDETLVKKTCSNTNCTYNNFNYYNSSSQS